MLMDATKAVVAKAGMWGFTYSSIAGFARIHDVDEFKAATAGILRAKCFAKGIAFFRVLSETFHIRW